MKWLRWDDDLERWIEEGITGDRKSACLFAFQGNAFTQAANRPSPFKISGSHGRDCEDNCLLISWALKSYRNLPVFQRCYRLVEGNKHLQNASQFLRDCTAHIPEDNNLHPAVCCQFVNMGLAQEATFSFFVLEFGSTASKFCRYVGVWDILACRLQNLTFCADNNKFG